MADETLDDWKKSSMVLHEKLIAADARLAELRTCFESLVKERH